MSIILREVCQHTIPHAANHQNSAIFDQIEKGALFAFNQGNLTLFDASTHNNQCHLIALKVIELYERRHLLNDQEKSFVILAFLVHLNSQKLLHREIAKMFPLLNSSTRSRSKGQKNRYLHESVIDSLLKNEAFMDQSRRLLTAAIFRNLRKEQNTSEIANESITLAQENNLFCPESSLDQMPTIPKFVGVLYMLRRLSEKNMPFIIRIKAYCRSGYHLQIYIARTTESPIERFGQEVAADHLPCLVIEGFSTEHAQKKLDRPCTSTACHLFHENSFLATDSIANILLCASADFTQNNQPTFVNRFFTDPSTYPNLTTLFQRYRSEASQRGLSETDSTLLCITHLNADHISNAVRRS